jgi:hypothetical protein
LRKNRGLQKPGKRRADGRFMKGGMVLGLVFKGKGVVGSFLTGI